MAGSKRKYFRYALLLLALLLVFPFAERSLRPPGDSGGFYGSDIKASIALDRFGAPSRGLTVGYNYELLRTFASEGRFSVGISICGEGESPLDSLRNGAVDILVLPETDSMDVSGLCLSLPVCSGTVWAMREEDRRKMGEINSWLSVHSSSAEGKALKNRFFMVYNPRKLVSLGRSSTVASPYDATFRECAPSLGWDWRMLAALAWKESQFKIQARSSRGAVGLMQMMPGTAAKFGAEDPVNPDESIRAGASYLESLQKIFEGHAPDRDSLLKLTLAAYNVGEGKMLSRLEDSLATGPGGRAFVDSVLAYYNCLRMVCP